MGGSSASSSGVGWEGMRRSMRFGWTAGRLLMTHQVTLGRLRALSDAEQDAKVAQLNRWCAKQALDLILDLKGYYIKAAQTLTGAGQLPPEMEDAFSVLLDQCPRQPFLVVKGIIESELGCSLQEIFKDFDQEAIAAASIGQVHFATLVDGTKVAVKIQYPEVEKYFKMDLTTVSFAMRIGGMGEKVKEVFATMQRQFAQEFDYTEEATIMREVASNVLPHFGSRVSIPLPIDGAHPSCAGLPVRTLCTRKVLTMERLEGTPIREHTAQLMEVFAQMHGTTAQELKKQMNVKDISKIDMDNKAVKAAMNMGEVSERKGKMLVAAVKARNLAARLLGGCMSCVPRAPAPEWTKKQMASPLNGARLARLLFDVHGHEIFQNGLFNSDPHAGNVLALPDGRLGLIDYGAVMRLTEEQRTSVARLFVAIADEDDDAVPPAFWACGFRSRNQDRRLALLLAHMFFNRGPFPYDMNRLAPKVGMPMNVDLVTLDGYIRGGKLDDIEEFPGHLVMLQRCAMVLSGIGMELGAGRLSSAGMLRPHAQKWLQQKAASMAATV